MPTIPFSGFVGGTYQDVNPAISFEDVANMYPQVTGAPGTRAKVPIAFKRTPGLLSFASIGNGPIKALFGQDDRGFAVSGTDFYELFSAGTGTLRSTSALATNANPAQIFSNGTGGSQLMVLAGGLGYIYDMSVFALMS